MKKFLIISFAVIISLLALGSLDGCMVSRPAAKRPKKIVGIAGRLLPYYTLSIDASYDSRLDHLIEGYKLLPVTIRNLSLRAIPMNASEDRWIVVGEKGKRYRAINSLRLHDAVFWRDLPVKIRNAIDYPDVIPINYNVTFDLLFPPQADLVYFREIRYWSDSLRQEFIIKKEY